MRIKMVILGVVACFAANAALAGESASKEENVGVGSHNYCKHCDCRYCQ